MDRNVKDIAVLVGSLRKDSINRKAALAIAALAPPSLRLDLIETGHLPFYNQEFDAEPGTTPAAYREFRERIARAASVIFATPEYNRSYPAVLKNAIDIGTRPYGKSVWSDKPAGGDQRLARCARCLRRQSAASPASRQREHARAAAA